VPQSCGYWAVYVAAGRVKATHRAGLRDAVCPPSTMQFYLDGYTPGDPDVLTAAPGVASQSKDLPNAVDALIVMSGKVESCAASRVPVGPLPTISRGNDRVRLSGVGFEIVEYRCRVLVTASRGRAFHSDRKASNISTVREGEQSETPQGRDGYRCETAIAGSLKSSNSTRTMAVGAQPGWSLQIKRSPTRRGLIKRVL